MSYAANCPNCGAPVRFVWSSAVQTTCEFCHSILVRTDVDPKRVGEVADLPPDSSPLQIGSEGAYQGKSFVAVGRIIYEHAQGGWNEWHIVYNDGSSRWLSDAQLEYDLSWLTQPPETLPPSDQLFRGREFAWYNRRFQVTSVTTAHYKGVWSKHFEQRHQEYYIDIHRYARGIEAPEPEWLRRFIR